MISNGANLLFLVVFLGQIFVSSWLFPRRILDRLQHVRTHYPPERYPKLYPGSSTSYEACMAVFRWSSRAILALGFAFLLAALLLDPGARSDQGHISEVWPAVYGVIQFLPLVLIELLGFRQFRLMRQANRDTTRRAELRPRRLFDFVSPALLALAVLLMAAVIGLALHVHDYKLVWHSDAVQQSLVMIVTNLALIAVGTWKLYGRKIDPYQASRDRDRQIRAQLSSLLLISCALSLYLVWQTAGDAFDLHAYDAAAISLYFQIIVALSLGPVMRSQRFKDIDFEVYKAGPELENRHA